MQFIIQQFLFPKQVKLAAQWRIKQCNYPNNYYGDQVCAPLTVEQSARKK